MARYHLTDDGPKKCSAQIECPLQKKAILNGEDPDQIFHYMGKANADKAYQEKLAEKNKNNTHTSLKKATKKNNGPMAVVSEKIFDQLPENAQYFLSHNRISGHINIDELDENSYKMFGFKQRSGFMLADSVLEYNEKVEEEMQWDLEVEPVSKEYSEVDLKNLSDEQHGVLEHYTGVGYRWINTALFNKEYRGMLDEKEVFHEDIDLFGKKRPAPTMASLFKPQTADEYRYKYTHPQNGKHSRELLRVVTNHLDGAIAQAQKHQKILYRGAKQEFDSGEELKKWLDKDRRIGNVIEFDGYTSASYNMAIADEFGSSAKMKNPDNEMERNYVMYEILTPEGLSVSSASVNAPEDEVLLPRKQRYVVVGQYSTESVDDSWSNGDGATKVYHVVQMVAVNENNDILDGTNSTLPAAW